MANKKEDKRLTAIVIAKNEEAMIGDCLLSLQFADEIIVADSGSTDSTIEIAKNHNAKIIHTSGNDYSQYRNDAVANASTDWVLYVDADERVTPLLRTEIEKLVDEDSENTAFEIPRKNVFLGKQMQYGGWGGDYVIRLFKRKQLKSWTNQLHEQPLFEGGLGKLDNELVHISHRDLSSMLEKTLNFTAYEATLRLNANHPPVVWWRFLRVMFSEFWLRFVKLGAANDGSEGIIDGMFQIFNMFVIYARLWEMQSLKQAKAK